MNEWIFSGGTDILYLLNSESTLFSAVINTLPILVKKLINLSLFPLEIPFALKSWWALKELNLRIKYLSFSLEFD